MQAFASSSGLMARSWLGSFFRSFVRFGSKQAQRCGELHMDAGSKRKPDGTTAERLKRLKRLKEEGLLLMRCGWRGVSEGSVSLAWRTGEG